MNRSTPFEIAMQSSKSTPMPIFNHRRRPRQALVADPNMHTRTEGNTMDLLPMKTSRSNTYPAPATSQSNWSINNQMSQDSYQSPLGTQKTSAPMASGVQSTPQANNQQTDFWQEHGNESKPSKNMQGFHQRNIRHDQREPNAGNQSQTSGSKFAINKMSQNKSSTYGNKRSESNSTAAPIRQQFNSQFGSQLGCPSTANAAPYGRGQQQSRGGGATTSMINPSRGSTAPQYPGNQGRMEQAAKQPQNMDSSWQQSRPSPQNQQRINNRFNAVSPALKSRVPGSNSSGPAGIEKSLHIVTTSIGNLKSLDKRREQIEMLYEVYGIIDSAVVKDATGTGKEFILKDTNRDQIQCVFYEIDRPIPKLTRGQWQRCIGNVDQKTECLKCVSIRNASLEEMNLAKAVSRVAEASIGAAIFNQREL